jgi:neural Wiskott-Aldrich syndrome protein
MSVNALVRNPVGSFTFSQEAPPEKKPASKVPKSDTQYAGPGTFVPSGGTSQGGFRVASTSLLNENTFRSSTSIPSSLRASSSLAQLDLYNPPYERERHASTVESIVSDFREMGFVAEPRRRESLPVSRSPNHTSIDPNSFA